MRKGTFSSWTVRLGSEIVHFSRKRIGFHNPDKKKKKTLWIGVKYKLETIVVSWTVSGMFNKLKEEWNHSGKRYLWKGLSILIFLAHCLGCLSQSFFHTSVPSWGDAWTFSLSLSLSLSLSVPLLFIYLFIYFVWSVPDSLLRKFQLKTCKFWTE